MVTVGITKAITNLSEVQIKLGVVPSPEADFFVEWRESLPTLTDAERSRLDRLKRRSPKP